jgi:hypothetical protein
LLPCFIHIRASGLPLQQPQGPSYDDLKREAQARVEEVFEKAKQSAAHRSALHMCLF